MTRFLRLVKLFLAKLFLVSSNFQKILGLVRRKLGRKLPLRIKVLTNKVNKLTLSRPGGVKMTPPAGFLFLFLL